MGNLTQLVANQLNTGCVGNSTLVQKVYFTCLIILIPITIIGNTLVVVVVLQTSNLRKQPMYIFITSLAFADILVGVISMPIKAKIEWDNGCFYLPSAICWIFTLGEIICSVSSTMHLFLIGIDRYFALRYTFIYKVLMSRQTHALVLLSVWMFSIVWSMLGIFQWSGRHQVSIRRGSRGCVMINRNYFTTTFILCFIAPVFLMMFIYSFIYRTAVRHVKEISRMELRDSVALREKSIRKRQFKALRSVTIVFIAYATCWLPCVIFVLLVYYSSSMQEYFTQDWFIALRFVLINFLPHFNSTLNPFIYAIFNNAFILAVKRLLSALRGKVREQYKYNRRGNRNTMPASLADVLYIYDNEDDNCFEMQMLPHDSPSNRRFTVLF